MNHEWETLGITCIDELLAYFAPIIKNWLRVLHDAGLRARLDPEHEEMDIFRDIRKRIQKLDWQSMEVLAVTRICRRITKHVVINAEQYEKRQKRNIPGTGAHTDYTDSAKIEDHRHGCNPECELEAKEFFEMVRSRLSPKLRRTCDLILSGLDNQQIADKLGLKIRAIQSMYQVIVTTIRRELEKEEIPCSQRALSRIDTGHPLQSPTTDHRPPTTDHRLNRGRKIRIGKLFSNSFHFSPRVDA